MKLHANHRQPHRETATAAPTIMVDYIFTAGEVRSDCVTLSIASYANEAQMLYLLKQALLVHLRAKYAPETFNPGDVVLF